MRRVFYCAVFLSFGVAACSSDSSEEYHNVPLTDANSDVAADAGSDTNADSTVDTGPDGTEETSSDTASDTASDTFSDVVVTDTPEADLPDGNEPDVVSDSPTDTPIDAPPPDGGSSGTNVIANPGFEYWSDGLPDAWKGEATNIGDDAISDIVTSPHGGAHACALSNPSSTHKRFSTAAFSLADGYYDCTYWVRGAGEVRNATYNGSSYGTYSSYSTVDSPNWKQISWGFNLHGDADAFELVCSVRSTNASSGNLQIDDVSCIRRPEPCDQVTCPEWAACDPGTVACKPKYGRCGTASDCQSWQQCDGTNTCVLAPGRCNNTADCDVASSTPVCDKATHTCVAGDPCAGVVCDEWKQCNPDTALCVLKPGRCNTTADCLHDLPACHGATHTCMPSNHSSNIVPNGGFESWSVYYIPYEGDHLIPDGWYGLDIPGSTEIDPERVLPYSAHPHTGALALQLIQDGIAERFTSELFNVPPGKHTCVLWVRGKGTFRHRT